MNEILGLSACAQARLIRERQIGSTELVKAHLRQIESVNPGINAATELLAERALDEARAADREPARGPLHGVPFSIKDSIELAGTRCTAGTVGRREAAASTADATVVARLRRAGAIPLVKTNLPDLLFAFEADNLLFGRTNNPYDSSCTSGGSSGGEAALIAACGSPMGLGSDCAGSVRVPAAFCGIAGIKPTTGRLPRTGHFPPSGGWIEALWQIGPMSRRVEDLVLMMRLLAGPDLADHSVADVPFHPLEESTAENLRVAWYADNGFAAPNAEVADVVRSAARSLGAVEDRPPCVSRAYELEMKLLGADGGDSLRAYIAGLGSNCLHPLLSGWLATLDPYRTSIAGFQEYWAEWDGYRAEMTAFLSRYDAIICPVYTQPALPHGQSIAGENFRGFSHTMAYNLSGLPAAVVRCGESASGLPIAVQVVARAWREDVALAVAARLERDFGGWKPAAEEGV